VEENVLARFFIYKFPTVPHRTLISDSAPVLPVKRAVLQCTFSSALQRLGSWVEDLRSELLIECSLADARVLESGFRVGKAACEIVISSFLKNMLNSTGELINGV